MANKNCEIAASEAIDTLSATAVQSADKIALKRYRRSFIRSLNMVRRPTSMEGAAITRAALLSIAAQQALADPTVSYADKTALDRCAARARRDAQAIVEAGRKPESIPPLSSYQHHREAAE